MNFDPLDLPGPLFLVFYVILLGIAHFAGKALARLCRAAHTPPVTPPDLSPLEAAYLAGGRERAVDAALVGLLHHEAIAVQGAGGFVPGKGVPQAPQGLQADLYREVVHGRGAIERLRRLRTAALARMEARLAKDGLLLAAAGSERRCVQLARGAPIAAVIALGALKVLIGIARSRPVVLLVVLLVVASIVLGAKVFGLPLRSAKGEAVLERLKRRNAALQATTRRRSADLDAASVMLAVGLFGIEVLANSGLLWMQPAFVTRKSGSDSRDSGCGSSGSCSGGCGGGCGGCGG